jgi:hypothetical protein
MSSLRVDFAGLFWGNITSRESSRNKGVLAALLAPVFTAM